MRVACMPKALLTDVFRGSKTEEELFTPTLLFVLLFAVDREVALAPNSPESKIALLTGFRFSADGKLESLFSLLCC